jgi:uncharacterized protein (TIGR00290 family)
MSKNDEMAAVLWTGGKDSCMALFHAIHEGYQIDRLVTFAPENPNFLAHPIDVMKLQAEAMGLRHEIITIHTPMKESFIRERKRLKSEGIQSLVTGDIAEVDGHRNWVRDCCQESGLSFFAPLWGKNRLSAVEEFLVYGFKAIVSCVNIEMMQAELVGASFNRRLVHQLHEMKVSKGIDLAGENGEYHTLVLDGPPFSQRIEIGSASILQKVMYCYLQIHSLKLVPKMTMN